jgi:hypothetical protein
MENYLLEQILSLAGLLPRRILRVAQAPDILVNTGEAFGMITAKASNPRIFQFAMKYQFS